MSLTMQISEIDKHLSMNKGEPLDQLTTRDSTLLTGLQRLYTQMQPLESAFNAKYLIRQIEAIAILKAVVTGFERWRRWTIEREKSEVATKLMVRIDALELKILAWISKTSGRGDRVGDVVTDAKYLKAKAVDKSKQIKFYKKIFIPDILGFMIHEIDATEDCEEITLLMNIMTQTMGVLDDLGRLTKQTGILIELAKQRNAGDLNAFLDWGKIRHIFSSDLDARGILYMQKIAADASNRNVLELAMHTIKDDLMELRQALRRQAMIPNLLRNSPIATARKGLTDTDMMRHYEILLDPGICGQKGQSKGIYTYLRQNKRFKISWSALAEYLIYMKHMRGGVTEVRFYLDKPGGSFNLKQVALVDRDVAEIGEDVFDVFNDYLRCNRKKIVFGGKRYDYLVRKKKNQFPSFGTHVSFRLENFMYGSQAKGHNPRALVQNIWRIAANEALLPREGVGKKQLQALQREIKSFWQPIDCQGYFGKKILTTKTLPPLIDSFAEMGITKTGALAIGRFFADISSGKIELLGIITSNIHKIFAGKKGEDNYAAFLKDIDKVTVVHNGQKKTVLEYLEAQMKIGKRSGRKGILQNPTIHRRNGNELKQFINCLETILKRYSEDSNVSFHSEEVLGLLGHAITELLMKSLAKKSGPQATKLANLLDKARKEKNWSVNCDYTLSYAYDTSLSGAGKYAVDHVIALERNDGKLIFVVIQDKVITNVKDHYEKVETMNKVIANDFRKLYQWVEGLFDEMVSDYAAKMKIDESSWGRKGLLEYAPGGEKKGRLKLLKIETAFKENRVIYLYGMLRYFEFSGPLRPLNGAGCGSQLKIYMDVFQAGKMSLAKHLTRFQKSSNLPTRVRNWATNMIHRLEQLQKKPNGENLVEEVSNTIIWTQNMTDRSKRELREIAYQIEGAIVEAETGEEFSPNMYKFFRPDVFNGLDQGIVA